MIKSRRGFLQSLGMGAATGAVLSGALGKMPVAYGFEPTRTKRPDGLVLLNSNENAYGPSPRVADAIRAATGKANRYPYRKYDEITERIASFHNVKPEQVVFGCGSTEILRIAAAAYLGNGRRMIQANPTFEASYNYAKSLGSEVISVPLNRDFAHDLNKMFSHVDDSTGLVYICNPNNPTSSLTARADLEAFIRRLPPSTKVVIDEAYHEFVVPTGAYASFIDTPMNDDRVIVTRTFSKVYGLAGLRLGYAVASPETIQKMRPFLTEDGLNAIAAEIVGVALNDREGVRQAVKRNRDDRQDFLNRANGRNLKPIDPHANFVMINTQHPAAEVIEHFRKHDVLIGRQFPLLDTYIRVSLGTPEDMGIFWKTWDMLPWSNQMMHH